MRVLLVTPPYHCGMLESAGGWLPLGLVYLAGEVRKRGHEVMIYDAMTLLHGWGEITKRIEDFRPDIVGIGAITATVKDAIQVCALAKELVPGVVTVMGNVHPTFMAEEVLSSGVVDFVVRGEGEKTFGELVDCLEVRGNPEKIAGISFVKDGRVFHTKDRSFIVDLDELSPAWDLLDWSLYTYHPRPGSRLAVVSSSRGCISQCLFCSQRLFWRGNWRARSAERFVAELEYLRRYYNVDVVMISDEYPTKDRNRWERILDLLIERDLEIEILMETRVDDIIRDEDIMEKYKKAGVSHIYVGVESPDQKRVDEYGKNVKVEDSKRALDIINQADIISETSFVLGTPDETLDNIRATLELAKFYNPDMAFFLPLTPWPYTSLYQKYFEFIEVHDWSYYNLVEPVIKPKTMNREELKRLLLSSTAEFFKFKIQNINKMTSIKKDFMIKVLKLIIERSYLSQEMIRAILPFKKYIFASSSIL